MRNYGCNRARLVMIWRRFESGQEEKLSDCVRNVDMVRHVAIEDLSNELTATYKFNFDYVSTEAGMRYLQVQNLELKHKVLKILETALKTEVNPLTNKKFNGWGVTGPIMEDIIKLAETGKVPVHEIAASPEKITKPAFSRIELGLLEFMKNAALKECKTNNGKAKIEEFIKKIRGFAPNKKVEA